MFSSARKENSLLLILPKFQIEYQVMKGWSSSIKSPSYTGPGDRGSGNGSRLNQKCCCWSMHIREKWFLKICLIWSVTFFLYFLCSPVRNYCQGSEYVCILRRIKVNFLHFYLDQNITYTAVDWVSGTLLTPPQQCSRLYGEKNESTSVPEIPLKQYPPKLHCKGRVDVICHWYAHKTDLVSNFNF